MADNECADVVAYGADLELVPDYAKEALAAHLDSCQDCRSYSSQIATTRELLAGLASRGDVQSEQLVRATAPTGQRAEPNAADVRSALLARAELLDPAQAEDLVQRSLEVGYAMQRRDYHPRGVVELSQIMHTLRDAQERLEGRTTPAVDVTASARARADLLVDLDSDADEPELFYPDLYPHDDELDGWIDSPNEWRGGAQILSPEEFGEIDETYDVLEGALSELPEPLGDLLALVDLQGYTLTASAQELGLDQFSATAGLARARNHARGRLGAYLDGGASPTRSVPQVG